MIAVFLSIFVVLSTLIEAQIGRVTFIKDAAAIWWLAKSVSTVVAFFVASGVSNRLERWWPPRAGS